MGKQSGKGETVYRLTLNQVEGMMRQAYKDELERQKRRIYEDAANTALRLTLSLPAYVLAKHYWKSAAGKKIPGFIEKLLAYYGKWQDGELGTDELEKCLWEQGGVRLEEGVRRDGGNA